MLEDPNYVRKPDAFMSCNNKLIARAYMMGRYGMLMCASNYSMIFGGKMCATCEVIDDKNHRVNYCILWSATNLYNSEEKIDFQSIYSNDGYESARVVQRILMMWDLGNGKNAMINCK